MVGKENWLFEGYCPQKSKLGLLLYAEILKIRDEKQINNKEKVGRLVK